MTTELQRFCGLLDQMGVDYTLYPNRARKDVLFYKPPRNVRISSEVNVGDIPFYFDIEGRFVGFGFEIQGEGFFEDRKVSL